MTQALRFSELDSAMAPCPLCGSASSQRLASADRYAMGIPTAMCNGCGLVMTMPRPTDAALTRFYENDYRAMYRKSGTPDARQLKKYGVAGRASYTAEVLEQRELLPLRPRVLDVGCGEGSILREIRSRRADASLVGVEPGKGYAAFARDYASAEIVPDLSHVRGRTFDLMVVNHVLEHVPDPVAFLRNLLPLLAEGGRIYVDVPDVERYGSLADLHIAHLYHFSAKTLAAVARKSGLEPIAIEAHQPPRHPRSLRAVLKRGDGSGASSELPLPDSAVAYRIRTIAATERWYRVTQWLPFRIASAVWQRVTGRQP